MGYFKKIFITMFCFIDRAIYWFVEKLYELFILISEAGIFSQATIQEFATRIYVFLGLIMIFQVSISLVNYIINPSTFDDKTIGGAALIKNAAISLVGIVLVPYVFEAAYSLQRIVLKENVIGNLILGVKTWDSQEEAESYVAYGGRKMAFTTFSSFVTFNPEVASSTCINEPVLYPSYEFNNDACGSIGSIPFDGEVKDEDGNEITTVGQYMSYVYKTAEVKKFANPELLVLEFKSTEGNYELFDYSFVISSVGGAFLIYILFKFCLDVAVRSVKLGFLQLIAPIPLMMRIDPRKGKQKFNKWVGECAKTFCDVFVRLAAIYFAIFIISAITTDGVQNVAGSANNVQTVLVKVGIIFGALMFAQQIPLLLADIIGGGKEAMQALSKSIGKATGKITNGVPSMVGGAAFGAVAGWNANAWAATRNWKNDTKGLDGKGKLMHAGKNLGSTIAGGASGMFHGGKYGYNSNKVSFSDMKNAGAQGMQKSRKNAVNRDRYQEQFGTGIKGAFNASVYKRTNQLDMKYQNVNRDMTVGPVDKEIKDLTAQYENIMSDEHAAREQFSRLQNELSGKYTQSDVNHAMSFFSTQHPDDKSREIMTNNNRDDAYSAYHQYMTTFMKNNPEKELSREEFNKVYHAKQTIITKNDEGIKKKEELKAKKNLQEINQSLSSNKPKPGDKK